MTSFLCAGRNYLDLMYESKLTWFLYAGPKITCFSVSIELTRFVRVVEVVLISVKGVDLGLIWGQG